MNYKFKLVSYMYWGRGGGDLRASPLLYKTLIHYPDD